MTTMMTRRGLIGMSLGTGGLLLSGCASMPGFSLDEAVRRLLSLSSQAAFARLVGPGGFFDSEISRLALPGIFAAGSLNGRILDTLGLRDRLARTLNGVAERGAERAAPVVADAIRSMTIADAAGIAQGGPTAATDFLRGRMTMSLVDLMVPEIGQALRMLDNNVVRDVVNAVSGYDISRLAGDVSASADGAIWRSIGAEESRIRANPQSTNDPLLIAVFGFR